MSTHLFWVPVIRQEENYLSDSLKFKLRIKYSLSPSHLTETDIPYLEGLRDARVEDAGTLIEAINTHGEIKVEESL